jgi:hypothetical protein
MCEIRILYLEKFQDNYESTRVCKPAGGAAGDMSSVSALCEPDAMRKPAGGAGGAAGLHCFSVVKK